MKITKIRDKVYHLELDDDFGPEPTIEEIEKAVHQQIYWPRARKLQVLEHYKKKILGH